MTVKAKNEWHMTTVAELIEVLKNCRPEAIVRVRDEHGVLTHKIEVSCYMDSCYNPPRRVVQIDKELDQVFALTPPRPAAPAPSGATRKTLSGNPAGK